MKSLFLTFRSITESLRDLPPLLFRLILAYGFHDPAVKKIGLRVYSPADWAEKGGNIGESIKGISEWFATLQYHFPFTDATLPMPAPLLNAWLATMTENVGYVCLFLGLATRLVSIPLMVVMLTAISTVHLVHGFSAGDNGFEIPLYYFLMLFSLVVTGPGRFSLDHLIAKMFGTNQR